MSTTTSRGWDHKGDAEVGPQYYLGRFCCLGVLSDVLGADLDTRDERGCVPGMYGGVNYGPEVLFAVLPNQEERGDLASLNDEGKTFAEIADYIEQNVPVS